MSEPIDSAPAGIQEVLDELTPSELLAYSLAVADQELIGSLKQARIDRGFTEESFGAILGISTDSVRAFEGLQTDPSLATIRRYAHALGVLISHEVEPIPGFEAQPKAQ